VYNCTHLKTGVRQPSLIQKQNKDDGQTQNWRATDARSVHTKSLAAVIKYSREQWPFLHCCCPILSSAAASSPLIGKRALCLSIVVLSVVHVSHLPLFSPAVVLLHDLQFFSAACFDLFS
jgi:hypothetical protein